MKYKVTIITEEIIEADNDFDCDDKALKIKESRNAVDYDFRKLDREEISSLSINDDLFSTLGRILKTA